MKTIGFTISQKENERRRALIPSDISLINNKNALFFEKGYGKALGFTDDDYKKLGVNIVSREVAFQQDIICCPKTPEEDEKVLFLEKQLLFGWIHAVQGREITDFLVGRKMTAIAWEEMYTKGRNVFWRNNELAGEAAVLHALQYWGRRPYGSKVALIGKGNTARGATRVLEGLGAEIFVYDRNTSGYLREEVGEYDLVVNAVLWDVFSNNRILYTEDLKKFKPGAMIIDVSCNHSMEIESSKPTTIADPVYMYEGVLHYVADHTPALLWRTASQFISNEVYKYIDDLVEEQPNDVFTKAIIIDGGDIKDGNIIKYQNR